VRWFIEASLVLVAVFIVSLMLTTAKPGHKKVGEGKRKLNEFVITCVMFALFTRALWLYGKSRRGKYEFGYTQALFTVGRISLSAFCLAFILVALEWGTLYRKLRHKDTKCLRRSIIVACTLLISLQMLYIILGWALKDFPADTDNLWYAIDYKYNVDLLAMIIFFFLTSSLFLFYGIKITKQLRSASENNKGKKKKEMRSTLYKVIMVSSVCSLCFGMRCVCCLFISLTYIYKVGPPSLHTFDQAIYPTLYYTVPEIIPSLTLVYVLLGFTGSLGETKLITKVIGTTHNVPDDDEEEEDSGDEEADIRTLDGPTRKKTKHGFQSSCSNGRIRNTLQ